MDKYHKIQTVFKRDPETNYKTLLEGEFSIPEFEYLKDNLWIFTEKVDGTNIRIKWDDTQKVSFAGKTDNAQIPGGLVNYLNNKIPKLTELFLENFSGLSVCLYGEGYGGKIQSGGSTYGPEQRFVLFDAKIEDNWQERSNVNTIAKLFNLDVVPVIGIDTLDEAVRIVKAGNISRWGNFVAERTISGQPMQPYRKIKKTLPRGL